MPALGGSEEIPTVEAEGEQQAVESGTLSPTEPDATGPAAGNRLPVDTEDPEIRQLATDLMREGRPAEAYWVARAGGLSAGIVAALRYAAAGFAVGTGGLSSVEIANRTDDVTEELVVADDTVATTIVVSAMARAVLADTFFPLCDSLDQLLGEANLDSTWHHAFSEAVRIARTGYRHAPTRRPDHNREQLEQMRRDARHLQETLGSRIIQYQRATLVLRHLSKPEGAWGRALSLAATVQEGDARGIAQLTELAKSLSDVRDVDELIDKADSALSPNKHRRDRIIAGARRQLQRTGLEVAQVVSQAASLLEISDSSNVGSHHERAREELVKSFQALPEPADEGLAAAAIWALRDWVLDPTLLGPVVDLDSLLRASSIQIVEAPRDDQDKIDDPGQISRDTLIAAFRSPLAPGELAQKYTELGNLALAEEILVEAGLGTDGLGAQAARLQSLHEDQLEEAQTRFASFRANNLLDSRCEAELLAQLEQLTTDQEKRYDLAARQLAAFLKRLDDEIASARNAALSRLRALGLVSPEDSARVENLIELSELATANEFLADLESGNSLPPDAGSVDDTFAEFARALNGIPQSEGSRVIAERFGGVDEQVDRAAKGLEAWAKLGHRQVWGNPPQAAGQVRAVLGLMGLDATDDPRDVTPRGMGRSGFHTLRVSARPTDQSIVPGLGSRCGGRYVVTVFTETRNTAGLILDAIADSDQQGANIILYGGVVGPEMRRDFLMESRRRKVTALLVDNAVIGLLAARHPGSFSSLQRVTLPFSAYDHWTPDVAGQVPDEVFVGRREELAEILNPAGSLFVYGGRQLGKSALLRRAERQFNASADNVAIYFDLKALGIGEYNEPDHLWTMLADELRERQVIRTQVSSPQSIKGKIEEWLDEDSNRRILLLLDESDLFLETESKLRREGGKAYRFRNVGLLKSLMEDTDRRFKPVFSGLHQVQRFHDISNTPLAHGGRDILVGPLNRSEAQELVQTPFEALGYRFASPDLMWGLLSFTNYQANLIQIACHALLAHLRTRRPRDGEPPTVISPEDVRSIVNSREVRARIAEKFNLTVRLEDRYKVIALVLAVNTLEDRFGKTYAPARLLADCAACWPQGFEGMKRREFDRYLDEMEGLGVLVRHETAGRPVTFRSPNVVPMLGSKEDIESELWDGAQRFDLPHDYNPRATRRQTGEDTHSPLTEDELGHLLPMNPHETPGAHVVVGSPACGIDRVGDVLQAVATDRGTAVEVVGAATWKDFQTRTARQKSRRPIPLVLVPDDSETNRELCVSVARHCQTTNTRAFLVLWPAGIGLLTIPEMQYADVLGLSGWSDEGLRSWENPFNTRPQRPNLLAQTRGWPSLVQEAVILERQGATTDSVISSMAAFPTDTQVASTFLTSVGILPRHMKLISRWVDYTGSSDEVTVEDLQEMFALDNTEVLEDLLAELALLGIVDQTDEGYRLDSVVWRCQHALTGP